MNITERAAIMLQQIDAGLALAEKASGDVPPDYTYCPGLSDYYEAATADSGWPTTLRMLKTAIEGLLPLPGHACEVLLTTLCDQWETSRK